MTVLKCSRLTGQNLRRRIHITEHILLLPTALFRNSGIDNHEDQGNESAAFSLSSPLVLQTEEAAISEPGEGEALDFTFHRGSRQEVWR